MLPEFSTTMRIVFAALDVDYRADHAAAACVVFADVIDAAPVEEKVTRVPAATDYLSGSLYLRELPALLAVLRQITTPLDILIVDGHVWLGPDRPGLGARLHQATSLPVIGVAKRAFTGAPAVEVLRGKSRTPLYVTAVGVDGAPSLIARMHGPHRLPTMLKRADRLARDAR
jgi:deoxyribonuclease V